MISKNFKKISSFVLTIALLAFPLTPYLQAATTNTTVTRAAIDIGSGATKLRVAKVDLQTQKITEVLETAGFAVHYQEHLSRSSDGNFDEQVKLAGLDAIKQSVAIAKKHGAEKVIAVATAAFRKAGNSDQFIDEIFKETGVVVNIIDQDLEGALAFQAVRADMNIPADRLVVWDIGGGSVQLTAAASAKKEDYSIYRGHDASTPFKNYVIEKLQQRSIEHYNTPNPLNFAEVMHATTHAQRLASKVDGIFKEKIGQSSTVVVGVGSVFGFNIAELGKERQEITRDELVDAVAKLVDKSDHEVGGGAYANVYVTNAILVLGYMHELNIDRMLLTDINPADGAFFHSAFWHHS